MSENSDICGYALKLQKCSGKSSALYYTGPGDGNERVACPRATSTPTYEISWESFIFAFILYVELSFLPLFSATSLRRRTFIGNVKGVGHSTTRSLRSRWRRFGRDPCSVSRVASLLKLFWRLAYLRQIPGFPQHPASCARTKGVPFFYSIISFACVPDPEVTFGLFFFTVS